MITITPKAAEQIRVSAKHNDSEDLCLRLAAKVAVDESLEYGMGFDHPKDDDMRLSSQDVDIVIAPCFAELLHGMTIDYVALEDGSSNFIFLNPNDPNFKPPKDAQ